MFTNMSPASLLLLFSGIAITLMRQGAMLTVLHALVVALAWPAALLSAASFIDAEWSIAVDRFLLETLLF